MNLLEQLNIEIKEHPDFWNYYKTDFINPLCSLDDAKRFIEEYFVAGSKKHIIKDWSNNTENEIMFRNRHSVNVFFIGAMLQRMIDPNIQIIAKKNGNYPFSYFWYLTCLAHDMGYIYEEKSKKEIGGKKLCRDCLLVKNGRRKNIYECFGINQIPCFSLDFSAGRYCFIRKGFRLAGFSANSVRCNGLQHGCLRSCYGSIEYTGKTSIRIDAPRYSQAIMEKYFKYRLVEMGVLDHGLVGADVFLAGAIENYRKQYERNSSKNEIIYDFINREQKHFCCEHFKIFRYIADCIASHNIYMSGTSEESKEKYKSFGLECLCPEKFVKIAYEANPLLFVLCVADTLESWKRFGEYDNETILSKLSIHYDVNQNRIIVKMERELLETEAGRKYRSDVDGLKTWCEIEVEVVPVDSVAINENAGVISC